MVLQISDENLMVNKLCEIRSLPHKTSISPFLLGYGTIWFHWLVNMEKKIVVKHLSDR